MKINLSKGQLSLIIVLGILILDQVLKIWIKTNMFYGDSIYITDWFSLRFIENPGMAFGMQVIPKVLQTIFRVILAGGIVWYITILIKARYKWGCIVCISLILAGAIGNILDSIFYGVIFSQSTVSEIATFVPVGSGYAGWLHGKVVDMFYFPLFEFYWPAWMPFVGGDYFVFFSPIFNLADAAISCGVFILFIFYAKSFSESIHLARESFKSSINKVYPLPISKQEKK